MGTGATTVRGRVRGVVIRWGTRGYGFISSPDLPREAWCHVRFIEDPGIDAVRPLPVGMELEFDPREVEGGKIQAVVVTRPGVLPPAPRSVARDLRSSMPTVDRVAALDVLSASAMSAEPAKAGAPAAVREVATGLGLAARVSAERRRLDGERARLEGEAQRSTRRAEAAEAQLPEVERDYDDRIAELQRERDRQVTELRQSAEKYRQEAESIRSRRDSLPLVAEESTRIVTEHLHRAHTDLGDWVKRRASEQGEVLQARRAAVEAVGEQTVSDFEEIRRRRLAATDVIEAKAYALAESTYSASLTEYADVLNRSSAPDPGRVDVVVLAPDDVEGRLILVAPIAPEDIEGDDDVLWRIGAFLFDTSERAAREMDAAVTVGEAVRCLAVELRPWGAEPELIEIAIREAWEARPSLMSSLSLTWDLIPGVDPPFRATDVESEGEGGSPGGPPTGGSVRVVARRLGLPLADLVAGLRGSGLPFHDDAMDAGVEQSLRRLLQLDFLEQAPVEANLGAAASDPLLDRSSPAMIARRILTKLLRDNRIGGRHARAENVWGHHFADDEKDLAREITERLIRRGLLLLKGPGRDRISIDPRRIADAQSIIDLRCDDRTLFEELL
jgi:hypothetical protein